jgi:3-oxoacyl-[acyl-carrier protein] reductase
MKDLKGKVAIITGGSRGIGRLCCMVFANSGVNVVFTYNKSKKEADILKRKLKSFGVESLNIQADVRNYQECRRVVEKTLKKFKKIDILINNAGIIKDRALVMMTLDDWRDVVETNLGGTFNMTRACITTFLKQKKGCIINMSSVSGLVGVPRQTNYSASKAGIIGFSKALAKEVAPYNIRVNVVCPGYINTDMVNSLREDIKKGIINSVPVKRLGDPEEVANVCAFLASEKASYITGEVIKIDGGLTI